MNRRRFWGALVGASSGAAAKAAAKPEGVQAEFYQTPTCPGCGQVFIVRTEGWRRYRVPAYLTCNNNTCRCYGRKFSVPTIALHPAPPDVVAHVDRAIEEERRAMEALEAAANAPALCIYCARVHGGPLHFMCPERFKGIVYRDPRQGPTVVIHKTSALGPSTLLGSEVYRPPQLGG